MNHKNQIFCQFQMYSDNINHEPNVKGSHHILGRLDQHHNKKDSHQKHDDHHKKSPSHGHDNDHKLILKDSKQEIETKMINFKTSSVKDASNAKFNYVQPFFYKTNRKV